MDEAGIHGNRTWRLTVVPRQWGELQLGPVEMTVFDPSAGMYRSQTLGPLALMVSPPPATPTPPAVALAAESAVEGDPATDDTHLPTANGEGRQWLWLGGALVLGVLLGGLAARFVGRKRRTEIPPRMTDQSPADRARELQLTLERWWMEHRSKGEKKGLKSEMDAVRRELEAVRFAPGRADHTETIIGLEERLRALMRRA